MKLLLKPFSYLWHHKKILFGLIALVILGWIFYPKPKPVVPTQKVTRKEFIQSVSVSGAVAAKNTVNLTFPTSGKITWVGVKKGDSVTVGQTLATLDTQTVEKNLQIALRNYSIQRNAFDTTQDQYGDTAPQDAGTTAIRRILQDNQYNLDNAVFSVELQDLARQQSILTTPIAGIVTRADTEIAGPDAVAGSTTFTVTDPKSLTFNADVDEADIGQISSGLPVQIVFDAYQNETLTEPIVSIDFVSHATSNGGNAYTIETQLPENAAMKYRVGMNANADIILSKQENVLTVPIPSIVDDTYVYVQTKKGFVKTKIRLGEQNDTDVQVLGGLSEGTIIALDPQQASTQVAK